MHIISSSRPYTRHNALSGAENHSRISVPTAILWRLRRSAATLGRLLASVPSVRPKVRSASMVSRTSSSSRQPNVDPELRIAEFPRQSFLKDCGKLYCRACAKEVSLRKVTVTTHVNSAAHKTKLETWVDTLDRMHIRFCGRGGGKWEKCRDMTYL